MAEWGLAALHVQAQARLGVESPVGSEGAAPAGMGAHLGGPMMALGGSRLFRCVLGGLVFFLLKTNKNLKTPKMGGPAYSGVQVAWAVGLGVRVCRQLRTLQCLGGKGEPRLNRYPVLCFLYYSDLMSCE
jgi:hypothetical protein